MKGKIKFNIFSIVLILAGIGVIVWFFLVGRAQSSDCSEAITATVSYCEQYQEYDSEHDGWRDKYRMEAEYEVDGEIYTYYEENLGRGPDEGDEVKLYYNPEDPHEVLPAGSKMLMPLVAPVGGILIAIGLYLIWPRRSKTA